MANSLQQRPLQLNRLLQHPLPNAFPIIRSQIPLLFISPLQNSPLPIRPLQPPQPRPYHCHHPARDKADAHRPVGITVQGFSRIFRVAFDPDVIERHDLRGFHAGVASDNAVPGETYNTFNSGMGWVCGGSFQNNQLGSHHSSKKKKKKIHKTGHKYRNVTTIPLSNLRLLSQGHPAPAHGHIFTSTISIFVCVWS